MKNKAAKQCFNLLLLFILINSNLLLFAQDDSINFLKYKNYRERLKLFVVPGGKPGESLVAGIRNYYDPVSKSSVGLSYGQQRAYLGFYIGVLATEFKLISDSGNTSFKTLEELDMAVNACIRLDTCENKEPWNLSKPKYDGFFMREDIPADFIVTHPQLNPDKYANSVSPVYYKEYGKPNYVNTVFSRDAPLPVLKDDPQYYSLEVMSQDEAINTLLGLALVKACIPKNTETKTREKAEELAEKIILYLKNKDGKRWRLHKPDSTYTPHFRGGNSAGFAYGLACAGVNITGKPLSYFWDKKDRRYKKLWRWARYIKLPPADNHLTLCLAAIADNWERKNKTTANFIKKKAAKENWETFYLLLYDVLQNKKDSLIPLEKLKEQLNSAPFNGPYLYNDTLHAAGGWASTNRFYAEKQIQENGDIGTPNAGNFNGLDYMLLYNLYRIRFAGKIKGRCLP